jgi:hypothetical protein
MNVLSTFVYSKLKSKVLYYAQFVVSIEYCAKFLIQYFYLNVYMV